MTDYFVDPLNGDDAAAGTSFGTAFKTTQKGVDTAVGGDRVFLSDTATETPSLTIDFDINTGSASAPIELIAADNLGVALTTGHYTISGSSLPASTDLIFLNISSLRVKFNRIRFTNGPRDGITNGTAGYFASFTFCRFDNFASDGAFITATGGHFWFILCEIDNNTGRGTGVNAAGRLNADFAWCNIHDNGGIGAEVGGDAESVVHTHCIFDSNGGDNARTRGSGGRYYSCTSYNSGGDGFSVEASNSVVYSCTSSNNTGFGYNISSTGDDNLNMSNNHDFNNTLGDTNLAAMPGENNQTGDPLFADAAAGDFQPSATSPLTDNSPNNGDIGAVKAASGGGGGSSMLRNAAMTGGMR